MTFSNCSDFAILCPQVEGILSKSRYLTGDTITEADVRLFTTLVRFDMVYVGHFKVNCCKFSFAKLYFSFSWEINGIPCS